MKAIYADNTLSMSKKNANTMTSLYASALVWALMAFIWLFAAWSGEETPSLLISSGLFLMLCVLIWFDFDHFRIPNWISYSLLAFGLLLPFVMLGPDIFERLAGGMLGYGLVWGLNEYWKRSRGQQGIGMGDAKLLAAAGAWLGVFALPLVTLMASGCALLWIFIAALFKRKKPERTQRLAFGPFIALGFWTVWQFGGGLALR